MTGALPLAGIRVLDFGQYIAGPAAAMMLGDQGAAVTRIDPPGGLRWASPAARMLNRRKTCLTLDLKSPADLATARRLIAESDVLIENFRPGVMARLGLGPREARALNPRLIYLSLPGFASTDAEYVGVQAWEAVIAAASGQFTDMGLNRVLMGINPSFSPLTLASAYGAALGAMSAVLALYGREATGLGDHIEVPLASALMEGLAYNSMQVEPYPERYGSPREREIARRRAAGEKMDMPYEALQEFLDPFYRSYICADGRPFYVVTASHNVHCKKALQVLGLLDEFREAGIPELDDWYLSTHDWPKDVDCALGLYPLPRHWAKQVSARMAEKVREKSSFDWEVIFGEAGIPAAAHRTTAEWLQSAHPIAAGLLIEVDDPVHGCMRQAGSVAWLKGAAEFAASDDAPKVGTAPPTEKVSPPAAAAPAQAGWLAGLRVLDLTNVIAGPTVAATLARFGAEVIKLDAVRPTFDPWTTVVFGMQSNKGKDSVLADLKTAQGQEILRKLLAWADVVTINALDRQLPAIGLTPEAIAAVNPKVILCQLDAFGGPRPGPRSDYPGYDDLVQASTGVMARFGGSLQTPEEHAHVGTIDVLAGFCATLATAIALFQRRRTGKADVARASLAAAGQLIQIPFMYDFAGRPPHDEPSGRAVKGVDAFYRCYQAADGWIFLAALGPGIARLNGISELQPVATLPPAEQEAFLAGVIATKPADYWVTALRRVDVGAARLGAMAELRQAHRMPSQQGVDLKGSSYQFIHQPDHPSGHAVELFAPCAIRPEAAPIVITKPAEKYGASTRKILGRLGYGAADIDALLRAQTVAESWSRQYLPD